MDGLDPVVHLTTTARFMLMGGSKMVQLGLLYQFVTVMVKFDTYFGPTLPDQTVPIVPLRCTWLRLRYTGYNGQTKNVISLPYNIFIVFHTY